MMRALCVVFAGLYFVSGCTSQLISADREPRSSSDITFSSWKAASYGLYDVCIPAVRDKKPVEEVLGKDPIFGNLKNARKREHNWNDPSVSADAKVYQLKGLRDVLIVDDRGACRVFVFSGDKRKIFRKLTEELLDVAGEWKPVSSEGNNRYNLLLLCSSSDEKLMEMVIGVSKTEKPPVSVFASVEPLPKASAASECTKEGNR